MDDARYIEARRHVAALRGFYIHALIFALVIALLVAINVVTYAAWWVQWPILGWGVGLVGHAVGVFMPINLFGGDWEQRKIRERMAKKG